MVKQWTFVAVAILVFTIVMLARGSAQETATPTQGRFTIIINPSVRADTFLVDTNTGMVWQQQKANDGEPVWAPMKRF